MEDKLSTNTLDIYNPQASTEYYDRIREMRQTRQKTIAKKNRQEKTANTYRHRAEVSQYISRLLMWNMFLIEATVKHHASSARERTTKAQKQLMQEVSNVWGKYSKKVDHSSRYGTVLLSGS